MRTTHRSLGSVLLLAVLLVSPALAQSTTGRIVGRIVDGETGQPVTGAQISVVGTELKTSSGVGGRYALAEVPSGAQSIQVRFIGYTAKTVSGVTVPAGGTVSQDVSLTHSVISIAELTVSAELEKGSVAQALDEQRTADRRDQRAPRRSRSPRARTRTRPRR